MAPSSLLSSLLSWFTSLLLTVHKPLKRMYCGCTVGRDNGRWCMKTQLAEGSNDTSASWDQDQQGDVFRLYDAFYSLKSGFIHWSLDELLSPTHTHTHSQTGTKFLSIFQSDNVTPHMPPLSSCHTLAFTSAKEEARLLIPVRDFNPFLSYYQSNLFTVKPNHI